MPEPLTTISATIAGKKLIETLVVDLTKHIGSKIVAWNDWRRAKYAVSTLYQKISSLRNVKTIWQIDREVDLHEFYHPTKVHTSQFSAHLSGPNTKEVHLLEDLPRKGNVVLQGMVGTGKSILLRYMGSQELQSGKLVPIFVELRYRTANRTLNDLVLERLKLWGFPPKIEVLDALLKSGKAALLCDAFDEIAESLHSEVVRELNILSELYPKTRIIVTSRPDSSIQKSNAFRVVMLANLTRDDLPAIIYKLEAGSSDADRLISSLKHLNVKIEEVLKTPLMVTLLVLSFKSTNRLPETVSDFYERLFETLMRRHDDTKPGYSRERKTKLSDSEIRRVFEAFCFFSRQQQMRMFEGSQVVEISDKAMRHLGYSGFPDAFVKDVKSITSLLLEDGRKHYFIHLSVQEYFCACFLRNLTDDRAKVFYEQCLDGSLTYWLVELTFLTHIDQFRCSKHFEIPLSDSVLKAVFNRIPSKPTSVSDAAVQRFVDQIEYFVADQVKYRQANSGRSTTIVVIPQYLEWFANGNSTQMVESVVIKTMPTDQTAQCDYIVGEFDHADITAKEATQFRKRRIVLNRNHRGLFDELASLINRILLRNQQAKREVEHIEKSNASIVFNP